MAHGVDFFTGDEYYVDPLSGSDSNAGTSDATAWATIAHALNTGIPAVGYNQTDGVRLNIKDSATITLNSASDFPNPEVANGNIDFPVNAGMIFQGYTSAANDGGQAKIINNTGARLWNGLDVDRTTFAYIDWSIAIGTDKILLVDRNNAFYRCNFYAESGASLGTDYVFADNATDFDSCYFNTIGGAATSRVSFNANFFRCVFITEGEAVANNSCNIQDCLVLVAGTTDYGNSVVQCNNADNVTVINIGTGVIGSGFEPVSARNCYAEGFTTAYEFLFERQQTLAYNNTYYNCTNAATYGTGGNQGRYKPTESPVLLSASPYTATDSSITIVDAAALLRDMSFGSGSMGLNPTLKRLVGFATDTVGGGGGGGATQLINGGLIG